LSNDYALFLPGEATGYRWLKVADGVVVARGEGVPAVEADDAVLAITPASTTTLHWAVLPDRSMAQATAAARSIVAEASLASGADLHVAVGTEPGAAERPIAVVSVAQMQAWIADLAAHGIDPAALVPAALLLPRPDEGFVRADLGGEVVVRGANMGFADDPALTPLLIEGAVPALLDRSAIEAAIVRAMAGPVLDLRQGNFARKRRSIGIDWPEIRRIAWLAAAVVALTIMIALAQIIRDTIGADLLDAQADRLARTGLLPGETVNNADRQLDDRLLGLRGPGLGFTRSAGAVFAAIRAVPASEATALSFENNGTMRVAIAAQGEGAVSDVRRQLESAGFTVAQTGAFSSNAGRVTGEFTVTPR
jgi:general secretion pathway protein L